MFRLFTCVVCSVSKYVLNVPFFKSEIVAE